MGIKKGTLKFFLFIIGNVCQEGGISWGYEKESLSAWILDVCQFSVGRKLTQKLKFLKIALACLLG